MDFTPFFPYVRYVPIAAAVAWLAWANRDKIMELISRNRSPEQPPSYCVHQMPLKQITSAWDLRDFLIVQGSPAAVKAMEEDIFPVLMRLREGGSDG
jgi:hypothetical protein